MNLYDLINAELDRMNVKMQWHWKTMQEYKNMIVNQKTGQLEDHPNFKVHRDEYWKLDEEIREQRKKIFAQFEKYDEKIQEKVAELALTGKE